MIMASSGNALDSVAEVTSLLETWERENGSGFDPVPILDRLCQLLEKETDAYYRVDPDPFDDRHPGRADPNCALGHMLKAVLKNSNFMEKVVSNYAMSGSEQVSQHSVVCRLLYNLLPGLETTVVFQENESVVAKLFSWSETAEEPLRSYATGLLAGAMESQDIAANFKDHNAVLVPLMLQRLHGLLKENKNTTVAQKERERLDTLTERPFANIGKSSSSSSAVESCVNETVAPERENIEGEGDEERKAGLTQLPSSLSVGAFTSPFKSKRFEMGECSSSSWAEMEPFVIGSSYTLDPLSKEMQQRLILQYLTPVGEYQELLGFMFEHKALDLIFHYINLRENRDVRLAFDALKFLAALLCHKKFAIEFINLGGVQRLLAVHRPSVAATGVSLCLYYLAYFEDAMERVCLLPQHVLSDLVSFVLWLLECSHESGRCHATMFFGLSFPFKVILELFDMKDGLRKLFNVMSTLPIVNIELQDADLNEDVVFTNRQACRHVTVALKKYFEVHLAIKADHIRRNHLRNEGGMPMIEIPPYKAAKFPTEVIQENMEILLEYMPLRMYWEPVSEFHKLGGVQLLLQLVAMASEWSYYTGKAETIRSALDVLGVCATVPKVQFKLAEAIPLPEDVSSPAVSILFGLADSDILPEPEVQKSALHVIINCVCGPPVRLGSNVARYVSGSAKKKTAIKTGADVLVKMWECVRSNNGIMVLLKLLTIKVPITEADSIRALACKALVGMSRSETMKQIISKLPLFNNGQLQQLMKEPVLQDKRLEHVKFCKYAKELIERVSGRSSNHNIDISLDRIRKADIVAQTKILYNEKELLQLIHDHLVSQGLTETAGSLQKEASLPRCSTPPVVHPEGAHIYATPTTSGKTLGRQLSVPGPSTSGVSIGSGAGGGARAPPPSTPGTPGQIKVNIISSKTNNFSPVINNNRFPVSRTCQKPENSHLAVQTHSSPTTSRHDFRHGSLTHIEKEVSLDKIVTEYLREQHALCPNPVVTCPSFSLLKPHRCPDPRRRSTAPTSITARLHRREILPPYGGIEGAKLTRKHVYSKFRPVRSYRDNEEDDCFSCCAFSNGQDYLMLGTYAGELKLFNIQTAEEAGSYVCHSSPLTHLEQSRDGGLMLTSSSWGRPLSALWKMDNIFDMMHGFEEDHYLEFCKQSQDKIIGTKDETAHIYDINTGTLLMTLFDQDKANNYTRNRATFNSTDDLVLNDGVLWDIASGKPIHKFDKFNPHISGVFHPMGLEIIINSEVWDLRTFHLLHTVPALDQCVIRFNTAGDIIYGAIHQLEEDEELAENTIKSPYGSSFRTFDATDYSNIATIDVKKDIFDLCGDNSDSFLAVIENQKIDDGLSEESCCRLYEVGRLRDEEDQEEEEEEEAAEEEEDEDDDSQLDDDAEDNVDMEFEPGSEDDGSEAEEEDGREDNEEEEEDNEEEELFEMDSDNNDDDSDASFDDDVLFELSSDAY